MLLCPLICDIIPIPQFSFYSESSPYVNPMQFILAMFWTTLHRSYETQVLLTLRKHFSSCPVFLLWTLCCLTFQISMFCLPALFVFVLWLLQNVTNVSRFLDRVRQLIPECSSHSWLSRWFSLTLLWVMSVYCKWQICDFLSFFLSLVYTGLSLPELYLCLLYLATAVSTSLNTYCQKNSI